MTKAGEKILAGLNEALAVVRGEALPAGVYHLTEESRIILEKAHLRGQEIERRHLKRDPE